ncbi:MAG: DUF1501 domain-containing protein [Pirellulales bacterium]|nr:DUF1501 domain-containing protein [Pirellulales bacterium]
MSTRRAITGTVVPASGGEWALSRRQLLQRTACGFGHLALLAMLNGNAAAAPHDFSSEANPLQMRPPQFGGRARRVIFLFMHGGVSHLDTFDPKPELDRMDGKPLPFDRPRQFAQTGNLLRSPWSFNRYGESGLPVSTLLPHVGSVIDEICLIRSMHVEQVDHGGAILQLHTGSAVFPRPSVGAWISYGLGAENEDLPAFVTIAPPMMHGAQQNYGSSFLPTCFQGTAIGDFKTPMTKAKISNLQRAEPTDRLQRMQLDFIQDANRSHLAGSPPESRLEARIESFELAFRMQAEAPDVLDLSHETPATQRLYGIGGGATDNFGRQCLLARRLIERGVRFVQCSHSYKWDQHSNLRAGHEGNAREVDLPIAGLVTDLKQRGLLDDTLVVWGTEFGRTPVCEGPGDGRDHNPYGFTMWLAGGGVRGGIAYGETDELGYKAVKDRVSMYDLHATVLHLLGIDHTRLTYRYNGRDFRLTDVHGEVVHQIMA